MLAERLTHTSPCLQGARCFRLVGPLREAVQQEASGMLTELHQSTIKCVSLATPGPWGIQCEDQVVNTCGLREIIAVSDIVFLDQVSSEHLQSALPD